MLLPSEAIKLAGRLFPKSATLSARAERILVGAQRALRSSEIAQYFLSAFLGSAVGALVSGLRRAVDLLHRMNFHLPAGHTLSAGIGLDPVRIAIVPALGGLALGLAALVVKRFRSAEIVDPIEANALHGGRMSMIDSLRLLFSTLVSNAAGASVGMEAGYSQIGEHVTHDIGETRECFNRGRREPGQ